MSSPADERESETEGSGSYAEQLAAAKLDPDRADFRTLRLSCAAQPGFNPYDRDVEALSALLEGRGSKFDVLTVFHPETGQTVQMFFNIDLVFGRGIGSELGGPPPKKPRRWWQFWK